MNSDEYLKVLQKYQENVLFDALVYQQDNAPIHKAKKIMDYFAENSWKIFDWPAYSPDLTLLRIYGPLIKNDCANRLFLVKI